MDNGAEALLSVAADRVSEARSGPADSLGPITLDFAENTVNQGDGAKQPRCSGPEASASLRAGGETRFSSALEGDPATAKVENKGGELNLDFARGLVN
ncbi:hypothetical protein [Roseobacter sp. AzwK-3b]|uniref:hypothetical protein n=1 Tax=Roseobacter sp. AzwK-3b TaxID=351016 RepID=UPI0012F4C815|nr:hypothetical protein [Roseobacter sp. AzwK-3b]